MQAELLNLFAVPLYSSSLNRQLTDTELACIREQVSAYRYFIKTEIGDVLIFLSNIRHGVSKLQENVE